MDLMQAMDIVQEGFRIWREKPHNAKWWSRIDGTPIPNDLSVNIAEAIMHSARIEALETALREAVKIAEEFDCHLCGYPNEEAEQFYSSGVMDASTMIAERIAALAPEQDK
jgi:hypothetical protein